ncbi:MAG: LysR family transcriptional regulator [Pseudomonadota bacterium]
MVGKGLLVESCRRLKILRPDEWQLICLRLRHLAPFHAAIEERSVSKSAGRISLALPAMSIALNRLKEMLGFPLFIRFKRYFVTVPMAEAHDADAKLATLGFERFALHAEAIEEGAGGFVRVGATGSRGFSLVPNVMSRSLAATFLCRITPLRPGG